MAGLTVYQVHRDPRVGRSRAHPRSLDFRASFVDAPQLRSKIGHPRIESRLLTQQSSSQLSSEFSTIAVLFFHSFFFFYGIECYCLLPPPPLSSCSVHSSSMAGPRITRRRARGQLPSERHEVSAFASYVTLG
ncbi:hypothetical protein AVEN_177874-1 [Araneus ventricosus]|uniref:Uncharacterized protein n=1 Tax=Araneus ventricosus TaxID=182803 RepID=A0A4Y2QAM9_ARAVE|nr:hypothetical protein AVEN_177874-1 [Araneus ventricosus]